jgi:uncharacterized repeat protein (TIGR03803 family)
MKLKVLLCIFLLTIVASLSADAHAQAFSVIHNFATSDGNGIGPSAGVTIRGGLLFGTATNGGGDIHNPGNGTVYQLTRSGSQWSISLLHLFNSSNDGVNPEAKVFFGPDGHLYSTTHSGAQNLSGTVFQLTPPLSICRTVAGCAWKEKIVHQFTSYPDGYAPDAADLAFDAQGNIYGTTHYGGLPFSPGGIVYELQPSGNNWTEKILYSFRRQPDGEGPAGGVIRDKDGNLFGTTRIGGLQNFGTVYELTNVPGTGWVETILYNFQNASDGENPWAGLVMDPSGNLYGATTGGGSAGGGTIFELSPSGSTWNFTVLYSLPGTAGGGPKAALTLDTAGNLYGTAEWDGANRFHGSVFTLTNTGNGWTYTSLHDFTGGADGGNPRCSVTIDRDGTLYGTTPAGGSDNDGVVWMIKP